MKNVEQQFSVILLTTSVHQTQSSKSVREYSDPIPIDLLIHIFSLVPAKSIARFHCVSKLWASILRRPDFTELFLTKSLTRPRLLFTVEADGKLFFYSSHQPQNPDHNSSLEATPYYECFPNYFPSDVCKTVCGLVMMQGWRRKVRVICNPATGEFLTLPKVLLKEKSLPKVKAKSNPTEIAGMYLGYDPISKQFKVLCMTSSCDNVPNTHQVLTLESGKRLWRRIEHKFHFEENGRIYGDSICINGVLYLGAAFGRSSVIVCFNVGSEKFGFINTNEELGYSYNDRYYSYVAGSLALFNYKGKLGIHHRVKGEKLMFWVLEDAANHKWFKHIYVVPVQIVKRFVGMTGTGEIVYSSYQSKPSDPSSDVFFYNLERSTFTRVNIQGFEALKHPLRLLKTSIDYVENLKFM